MIKNYSNKANLDKKITNHYFRHIFASNLLKECKKIRIVQKALGHNDISTTHIYAQIVDEELEHAMKNLRN